jgi:signal transduction histidine kinase
MSSEKPSGRFGSIAWSISWSFWWRKFLTWLLFDLLAVCCLCVALIHGYNQTLPGGTLQDWPRPTPGVTSTITSASNGKDLADIRYVVATAEGETYEFALAEDVIWLWPALACVGVAEVIDLLGVWGDTRRVRRKLAPLNELALRADELGRTDLTSFDKIETLEQAIGRASVDSPQVSTGDKDLASIEVALNRLLRQMQEAKLQQMRFVNDASHELRTPIAVIQGYVNMLDRWGKSDEAVLDESIEALKSESEHMQELVEQLLFLARGDSGRNALHKVSVNLAQIVTDVWEESAMIDKSHDYVLGFDEGYRDDARYQVTGDVAMLKQSIRIIVQNAEKYSPEGSTITFGVASTGGGASCSVTDEGIGMSSEAAGHVFERFYRADNARDSSSGGSGLGLSIAKWIVDNHGGTIDVLSREGVGTRFTITIPR